MIGGWVHSVQFDAAGNRLAWVGHDSTVNTVVATANVADVKTIKTNLLPFLNCVWAGPTSLVVAVSAVRDAPLDIQGEAEVGLRDDFSHLHLERNVFKSYFEHLRCSTEVGMDFCCLEPPPPPPPGYLMACPLLILEIYEWVFTWFGKEFPYKVQKRINRIVKRECLFIEKLGTVCVSPQTMY